MNANLGSATGALDGGPHWVPDDVWITLSVEDAHGNVTAQSAYLDHERAAWRGGECIGGTSGWDCIRGYERLTPPREPPVVTMQREDLEQERYRFTGSGSSPDGRIVDTWWEITRAPMDPSRGAGVTTSQRGDAIEVRAELCETVDVSLVYLDDLGQQGRAWDSLRRSDTRGCVDDGAAR